MPTYIFNIEHKVGEDDWQEWEYEVGYDFEPYDPGRCSGPPEDCYPPEGGYAEVTGDITRRPVAAEGEKPGPWQATTYEQLLEAYVVSHDIEPKGRQTAMDIADEKICEELYEAAEQEMEDAEIAVAEAKYDYLKDEGLI